MTTLLQALNTGRASALRKVDLAARTGLTTRQVEAEIERLRKGGRVGICSDSVVGYWLPESVQELAENVERRRKRAIHQMLTVRGERACVRRWTERVIEQGSFGWDVAA